MQASFATYYSGWVSRYLYLDQYFQVGNSFPVKFERMILSGRTNFSQWISSFKIKYSLDGLNWVNYKNSQIFPGNTNSIDPVELIFEPFIARSVRIYPITWSSSIGGHFEFYISQVSYSLSLTSNNLIRAVASGFKMTSSSVYDNSSGAIKAAYDIKGTANNFGCEAWAAGILDQNQWIMISSPRKVLWRRIGTMGNVYNDQRVNSYYISYTENGFEWTEYKNKLIFQGNKDRFTAVEYDLEPFEAIAIRLHPITWNSWICTRVEAYCSEI